MAATPKLAMPAHTKRLAIFLDGTWNAVGDNTNVWRLKSLCAPADSTGTKQLAYYEKGVNGLLGGLFGEGLDRNITKAYQWLIDNYEPDDDVFIFGFSRGAYTARSLAGFISKCGLLRAGAPLGVNELYGRYRRADARTISDLLDAQANGTLGDATREEQWMLKYSMAIRIKLVGVWDTVGELGIPLFSIPGISRSTLRFLTTGLRRQIDFGFQALAIDEHRRAFSPTLWTFRTINPPDPDEAPRPLASVEQRWFAGAHANVGGGCQSDPLPQLPLRWMMNKASLQGLAFRYDVEIDADAIKAPVTDSYSAFLHGIYHWFSAPHFRPIAEPARPIPGGTEQSVNETIDASVFARWNYDAKYRPPNLIDWAKRYRADIANLTRSVLAGDPAQAAPD